MTVQPQYLLVEASDQVEVLTEQTDTGKKLFLEGIFAQAELTNNNKRFYKRDVMESAVNKYISEYVLKRRALGELNHPDYPLADPANAAVRITEMRLDGNNVYGKALVLDTPKGMVVKGLLEGGFALGVSTRGLGTLKENNGIKYVQNDYQMTAVDCVDNPSGPNCFPNAIMESSVWSINESGLFVQTQLKDQYKLDEQTLLERIETYVKSIKKKV